MSFLATSKDLKFAVRLSTENNIYCPNPENISINKVSENEIILTSKSLSAAGGQLITDGMIELKISEPIEVRVWGPGWPGPGPVDKSEGFGGRAGPGPVDKSEGLGWPKALSIKVTGWEAGLAQGRPIVPWWIWSQGQVLQTK